MAKASLVLSGPIIVYVELVGPRTSRIITMAVDTGAVLTMIPGETARAIGYDPTKTIRRVELVTASGIEFVPVLTVRTVHCLGQTLKNLEVACHDLPVQSPVKGLLGLNFLIHFPPFQTFVHSIRSFR